MTPAEEIIIEPERYEMFEARRHHLRSIAGNSSNNSVAGWSYCRLRPRRWARSRADRAGAAVAARSPTISTRGCISVRTERLRFSPARRKLARTFARP